MKIKTVTGKEPIRYAAHENPGTLILHDEPGYSGGYGGWGRDIMAYSEPMSNQEYPHIADGIFASVSWHAGVNGLWLDVHATKPTKGRDQKSWTRRVPIGHDKPKRYELGYLRNTLVDLIRQAQSWIGDNP